MNFDTLMSASVTSLANERPPTVVEKPWGREVWFANVADQYAGKLLAIRAGRRLSLQRHHMKHETLLVLSGRVRVTLGDDEYEAGPLTRFTVPTGTVHRMEALDDAVLAEVSTPHLDDVERIEDDFNRR